MSAPLTHTDVLHWQRLYACAGFYTGKLDGEWGPRTDAAYAAWEASFRQIRDDPGESYPKLDARSEGRISTLLPAAQRLCRRSVVAIIERNIDARVLSGTRTYAEQDAIYAQGRTKPGAKVTNARAGQSNHQFGIAWDIGIFQNGRYLQESTLYNEAGPIGKVPGVEWGGDWRSMKDRPHFQLATGMKLSEVRKKFEAGKLYL